MDTHALNLLGALAVGCADRQAAAVAEVGLQPAELAALLAVHTRPGSTVGQVAATTGLTHSGAVRVIDRLSSEGRVERRVGRDRRAVALFATAAGRKQAKLALSLRHGALEDAVRTLTTGELATLARLAGKILAGLPGERPDAWRICRLCDHSVCRGEQCPVGSAVR